MKNIFVITLAIFSVQIIFGQEKRIARAVKNYEDFDYAIAIKQYENLIADGVKTPDMVRDLANAYYYTADYQSANKWYADYIDAADTLNVTAEYYYRYAQTLRTMREYDKSNQMMEVFLAKQKNDPRAVIFKSNKDYMKKIEENSGKYELKKLSINSSYSDFGASFSPNDGIVFSSARDTGTYTRKLHALDNAPFLDLYKAKIKKDGQLVNVTKFSSAINTKYHESTTVFTKDSTTVYFTRNNYVDGERKIDKDGLTRLKLLKASYNKVTKQYENIVELPFNSNQYSVAHPALSTDEKTLYFASDMPGTYGMSDIFAVAILDDNQFGEPVNLGPTINTPERETFPFIGENGNLYFSSDGRPGLGGLDIFVTEPITVETSSTVQVQNLGRPINSVEDDFSWIYSEAKQIGYISSNRSGGKGNDDIYLIKASEEQPLSSIFTKCEQKITGYIKDVVTQDALDKVTVELFDATTKTLVGTSVTNKKGYYEFLFECDKPYYVSVSLPGYAPYKTPAFDSPNFAVETPAYDFEMIKAEFKYEVGEDLAKTLRLEPYILIMTSII